MRKIIPFLLLASTFGFSQAWTGILPSTRAIDWSQSGLPSMITYGTGGAACDGTLTNCVETTVNPWTLPTRIQCGSTISAGAPPATINAAIAACKPGTYVLLATGTYSVNANIVLRTNGVSLRGADGSAVILNTSSGAIFQFGVCCGTSTGSISGTPVAGATSVTMTSATGNPSVNQMLDVNQCDPGWTGSGLNGTESSCTSGSYSDPGTIWPCGIDQPNCSNNNGPGGTHSYQHQTVVVTGVSGTCSSSCTVTFTPGLYMPNWGATSNARFIWQSPSNQSIGVGLEDVSINFTYLSSEGISTQSAYAWWVQGVSLVGDGQHARMSIGDHSAQGLFFSNYIFAENDNNLFTAASEPLLRAQDTGTLILNNIITGGLCLWGNGKLVGEVVAYNYCRDSQTPDNQALMLNHNPFESFTLFEGNQAPQIHSDNTHGTNALITYHRNHSSGYDSPYITTHARSYLLGDYNRFNNYIGNALGSALTTTYSATGYDDNGKEYVFGNDALTSAAFMRWGNCDVVTGTCRFQSSEVPNATNMPSGTYPNATAFQASTPGNNNLPCSFFMPGSYFTTSPCVPKMTGGTGLSWWKVCVSWTTFPSNCASYQAQPFPSVGPDQSGGPYVNGHAYDNPAAIAYRYLPINTARQGSFTITGSSWSNNSSTCQIVSGAGGITTSTAPCEILTVSLSAISSNAEHIMGGFQLSGVNSGCIPAGINFANLYGSNEILMTGSNTTQIAYSLPSSSPDNGSSNHCTGTLKFPDIRKFDERVYATDTATSVAVLTPSSLTYSNQTVGTTSSGQAVTLSNAGSVTLNIASIAVTGDYSESDTCSSTLAAGVSCTITVFFTPTTAGTRTGTLTVTDDSGGIGGGTQTTSLSGTGVAGANPIAQLLPSSINFGSQTVGTTSSGQQATLTNIGGASLTIAGNSVTGDFGVSSSCSSVLGVSSSCTYTLTFSPTTTGSRTGVLTVTDNSNGIPGSTQTVNLSGTGTALPTPGLLIKGNFVAKGNIVIGTPVAPGGAFFAALPTSYVNAGLTTGTGFCSPPGGIYDATKTMPGDYAATFAGLQQAKTDQVAANQWWLLKVAAGTNIHGSSYNGDSALLTWPTSGSVTKCLVVQSSTHNTDGQIVCMKGLPGYGGPSTLADNADAHNCIWSSKNDASKFWKFTIDASGGTYGMLFPKGPSYVLVEDMEAAPAAGTNQSALSSNPQLQVAMVFCDHCAVAYSWIHGWDPGDAGQPAGVCGTTGSWNRSGTVNTSGTSVTWVSGDQFGMDFADASSTNAPGFVPVTTGGNAMIIGGTHFAISNHDPVATATTLTLGASAGSQSGVAYTLVNPASAYATGCGDDSRGVQMNCANCFLEFSAVLKVHWWGQECHAVSLGFGQGATLIAEDWLEGAGAALFTGGADIQIRGGPQSDLEVGNTYLGRDLRWRLLSASNGTSPSPPFGSGPRDGVSAHDTSSFAWSVKTVLELKECNRCWFHGVILENGWPEGQSGHLFALTVRAVSGGDIGGVYDPSTGFPATILQNIRMDNFWMRNAAQGIGFGPRSLSPGNGGGISAMQCCIDIINGLMTNMGDQKQFGNPGDELLGVSNAGQIYLATLSRTSGVAHAVVTPMNIANYDPGSGNIHSNIGTYKSAYDISSIVNVQTAGPVNTVTIHFNKGRTDPKVGGSFTMANVSGWNGTFSIASAAIFSSGSTYVTTACTLNAYGVASAPLSQPQPCIRSDGTYGDTIVYVDNVNTFSSGTTTLCSTLAACNALAPQALLDTLAYKITDINIGDGVYVHNCTGGSLGNPALFQVGASSLTPSVSPTNPIGLDVYYNNAGSDDSGVSCQLENSSGTPSTVSFQHVTVLSPTSLATNSDGLSSQHFKHYYLHNVFATTGTATINTCNNISGEGTVSFPCWDNNTFQFFDNVLQGRTSGSWSVVPGGSLINFPSPNPSTVTCSGSTATSGCLGLAGFMSATAFPTAACTYDGSNIFNCPLVGAPYGTNVNLASFTPVGTSSYSSEGVDINQLNTNMNATQGVCPVGAYCGATGPFPY